MNVHPTPNSCATSFCVPLCLSTASTTRVRRSNEYAFIPATLPPSQGRIQVQTAVGVHERTDLTDSPRFFVTDALHWESGRILEMRSFRCAAELFHEFSKQGTGLEAAQVRNEEAVKRHLRLSCLAQSLLQRAPAAASKSEKFAFAEGEITFGQRCRTIAREVFHS